MSRIQALALSAAVPLALLAQTGRASAGTTIFSSGGYSLPESITPVTGFGPAGTGYIVPDPSINQAGSGQVWAVPQAGGAPSQLANFGKSFYPVGGTILPSAYGGLAGQYIAVGNNGAYAVTSGGATGQLLSSAPGGQFEAAIVAPSGFGAIGGRVLISDNTGGVDALATSGHAISTFSATGAAEAFGLGFAPTGFGAVAGDLLVTDASSGKIFAVNSTGKSSLFATVALLNAANTACASSPSRRKAMAFTAATCSSRCRAARRGAERSATSPCSTRAGQRSRRSCKARRKARLTRAAFTS